MNKLLFLLLCLMPLLANASEGASLASAPIDVEDQPSLQRGARMYAEYCQGCHSLKYMRYSRFARDAGVSEAEILKDFLYGTGNVGDSFQTSLSRENGVAWFGVAPPDLSLAVRARGADWVYTYLRSFYNDPSRPSGVNNLLFKDVAMPNVLGPLQGDRVLAASANGHAKPGAPLQVVQPGKLSADEFDDAIGDLTNFLAYVAEPAQLERARLGKYVLLFLAVLFVILYKLKKEYWRDVH